MISEIGDVPQIPRNQERSRMQAISKYYYRFYLTFTAGKKEVKKEKISQSESKGSM